MKWIKGEQSVELSQGILSGTGESVWDVECVGIDQNELPIETRELISVSDNDGYQKLVEVLSKWAAQNGFELV